MFFSAKIIILIPLYYRVISVYVTFLSAVSCLLHVSYSHLLLILIPLCCRVFFGAVERLVCLCVARSLSTDSVPAYYGVLTHIAIKCWNSYTFTTLKHYVLNAHILQLNTCRTTNISCDWLIAARASSYVVTSSFILVRSGNFILTGLDYSEIKLSPFSRLYGN